MLTDYHGQSVTIWLSIRFIFPLVILLLILYTVIKKLFAGD